MCPSDRQRAIQPPLMHLPDSFLAISLTLVRVGPAGGGGAFSLSAAGAGGGSVGAVAQADKVIKTRK